MKANELRIGNLFRDKYKPENIFKVYNLGKSKIVFDYITFDKWQSEPIPLTEEWLLKFGFKFTYGKELYGYNYYDIKINDFTMVLSVSEKDDFYTFSIGTKNQSVEGNDWIEIEYVHTLQNLYFALTQKELK